MDQGRRVCTGRLLKAIAQAAHCQPRTIDVGLPRLCLLNLRCSNQQRPQTAVPDCCPCTDISVSAFGIDSNIFASNYQKPKAWSHDDHIAVAMVFLFLIACCHTPNLLCRSV